LRTRDAGVGRAAQRLLQPDDGAQQARFAGARRPDQADELTFANLEARAFEDRLGAVGNR
jgi:hypothetical protein